MTEIIEFLNANPGWMWFIQYWIFSSTLTALWFVHDDKDQDVSTAGNVMFGVLLGWVMFPIIAMFKICQMHRDK